MRLGEAFLLCVSRQRGNSAPLPANMEKPENIPEGDFANYFCTYGHVAGRPAPRCRHRPTVAWFADAPWLCAPPLSLSFLYHQKEMLEDQVRMQAYYDAVHKNKSSFEGKAREGQRGGAPPH